MRLFIKCLRTQVKTQLSWRLAEPYAKLKAEIDTLVVACDPLCWFPENPRTAVQAACAAKFGENDRDVLVRSQDDPRSECRPLLLASRPG